MKNNIITTVLGIALFTAGPLLGQTATPTQNHQKPPEARVVQTTSSELTFNLQETERKLQSPQLPKVGKLILNPKGRAKHDEAPSPKPLIYVEGFETP